MREEGPYSVFLFLYFRGFVRTVFFGPKISAVCRFQILKYKTKKKNGISSEASHFGQPFKGLTGMLLFFPSVL